ncbi:MAG TPA: DUF6640 family protein [Edaphobacter sp.]|nr:DUF6640 family protein [Edaphobacter sp.]
MRRITLAKVLMTFVLLGGSALSFVLDWSSNHLLNPLWHPHARFHGALALFLLAGVSVTATWLIWRQSKEPEVAFAVATAVSVAYWTPLFYVPFLLPSATWWAGRPGAEPRVDGMVVYPNLIVAGLFLVITLVAYRLGKAGLADRHGLAVTLD